MIIATGYATPQFRPLAGQCRMFTYVVATERMDAAMREERGLTVEHRRSSSHHGAKLRTRFADGLMALCILNKRTTTLGRRFAVC